jgi:hypothetical protein
MAEPIVSADMGVGGVDDRLGVGDVVRIPRMRREEIKLSVTAVVVEVGPILDSDP